jgi:hypothetical protein
VRRYVLVRRRADHRTGAGYPRLDGAPYVVAITGGSGKYAGAEGEIHVRPVSGTEGILTFDLQD